jgi:hypothetical protein
LDLGLLCCFNHSVTPLISIVCVCSRHCWISLFELIRFWYHRQDDCDGGINALSARTRDDHRQSVVEGMYSKYGSKYRLIMTFQPRYCVLGTGSQHHSDSSGRGSRKASKVPSKTSQIDLSQPDSPRGTTLYITIYKAKVRIECPSLVQCLTYAGRLGISAATCSVRLQDMRDSGSSTPQTESFSADTHA